MYTSVVYQVEFIARATERSVGVCQKRADV